MPQLLHEYWDDGEGGGEFGRVQESSDKLRQEISPGAQRRFSCFASSWNDAMQIYYDRMGFGTYTPVSQCEDLIYSEDERNEQLEYLSRRIML